MQTIIKVATYTLAIVMIVLLTFGQDVPTQYLHWVNDGVQACVALALFFTNPDAFIAKMTTSSKGQLPPIPAVLAPVPGMPGLHELVPVTSTVAPEPLKAAVIIPVTKEVQSP